MRSSAVMLCFVSSLLLTSSTLAQAPASQPTEPPQAYGPEPLPQRGPADPKSVCEEYFADWGVIFQGEVAEREFLIRNDGGGLLRILDVESTFSACEVTAPDTVAPGQSGRIRLKIHTGHLSNRGDIAERRNLSVSVRTNDPIVPVRRLYWSGRVRPVLRWQPKHVRLEALAGDLLKASFELEACTPVELISVRPNEHRVKVRKTESLTPDRWRIALEAPRRGEPVPEREQLVARVRIIETGSILKIPIPVSVHRSPRVELVPPHGLRWSRKETEVFRQGELRDDQRRALDRELRVIATDPDVQFEIESIDLQGVPEGLFDIQLTPEVPGRRYRITVSLVRDHDEIRARGNLRIFTNDPAHPVFDVRVFAQFKRLRR